MIEWIPIWDYGFTVDEEFLVLIKSSSGNELEPSVAKYMKQNYIITQRFNLTFNSASSINPFASQKGSVGNYRITHAAPLNLPKEKTLEEKFEEFRKGTNEGLIHVQDLKHYTYSLALIAKQHYEGEK